MTTVKDFVKETLEQITEAVQDFGDAEEYGVTANPSVNLAAKEGVQLGIISSDGQPAIVVNFDLAVTVQEGGKVEGNAGLKIASLLQVGGGGTQESSTQSVSRVKFALPVRLGDKEEHRKKREHVEIVFK